MFNNHDIWALMDIDSTVTLSILHIPTVVFNQCGNTVIIGFSSKSLVTKLEVNISTDSLLDTVTRVDPVKIDSLNSFLPPPDNNRHTKVVKLVGSTTLVTTRVPLVVPLVGRLNAASVRFDEYSAITTATKCHPIALHWLTAIMDFYENRENGTKVLRDFKGQVLHDLNRKPYHSRHPTAQQHPDSMEDISEDDEPLPKNKKTTNVNEPPPPEQPQKQPLATNI